MKRVIYGVVAITVLGLVAVCAAAVIAHAQEKVTLGTPVYQSAGAADFRVESLYLKRGHPDSPAEIRARLREVSGSTFVENGRDLICRYDGAVAETLLVQLNKANLSTTSLERRVVARCQQDGKIPAGSITGSPE